MEKVGQGRRGSRGMLYVVLACGWHEEVSVAGDIGVWKKGVKGSRNETLEVSTINQPPKLDGQSTFQPLGDFIRIYIYNHPEVHRILVQLNPAAQKKVIIHGISGSQKHLQDGYIKTPACLESKHPRARELASYVPFPSPIFSPMSPIFHRPFHDIPSTRLIRSEIFYVLFWGGQNEVLRI